jgi:putative transposase
LRVEFKGAWYHVMNRGASWRPIFNAPIHRTIFFNLLDEISQIFCVEIHAYCLMENHYHLLLSTPEAGLGRAMRHLNGLYTQRFNRLSKMDGPLFRGRYKAILVDADAYLLQLNRYIHLNPVAAGLAQTPEAYAFSSYKAYLGLALRPRWLCTAHSLSLFSGQDSLAEYREFVESGIDEETREFYDKPRLAPILGHAAFQDEVRSRAAVESIRGNPEIPDARRVRRFELAAVSRAICISFRLDETALRRPSARERMGLGLIRGAFTYLARFEGGHSLQAIADWLGYQRYTGPSVAMARFLKARGKKPDLARRFEVARQLLYEVKT